MKIFPDSSLLQQAIPAQPGFLVLVAPHAGRENMLVIAARLALRGPLRVLDGGNRFNAYLVARMLRYLGTDDLTQSLRQIQIARAFTCYQMVKLLEETPVQGFPLLVIDLLDTFNIGQQATVVVSLRPPRPPLADPTGLLETIQEAADQVWFQAEPDCTEYIQAELLPAEPAVSLPVLPPIPGMQRQDSSYPTFFVDKRLSSSKEL
jgi:hypothetical protein